MSSQSDSEGGGALLTPEEFIVAVAVAAGTVVALLALRVAQYRSLQRRVAAIPRPAMPLLRRGDVSPRHAAAIVDAIVARRAAVPSAPPPDGSAPPPPALHGWEWPPKAASASASGESAVAADVVHYKTTIARMCAPFERCAAARDPALVRPRWMCFREFAEAVAPTDGRGAEFATIYEHTRFGPDEYTPQQAQKSLARMAELIAEEFPEEAKRIFN